MVCLRGLRFALSFATGPAALARRALGEGLGLACECWFIKALRGSGLTIQSCACFAKTVRMRWKHNPSLSRSSPNVRVDGNPVGVIQRPARDGPELRPALEREPDCGSALGTELNVNNFAAALREMVILTQGPA
jgi:hypothetical protein